MSPSLERYLDAVRLLRLTPPGPEADALRAEAEWCWYCLTNAEREQAAKRMTEPGEVAKLAG